MLFKEYEFLNKTIFLSFPKEWRVKKKSDNMVKVSFPFGPYPTLDCYLNCFDNPKINSEEKIKSYLLDGITEKKKVKHIGDNTYMLEYKLKSEGDNLLIYKIIEYLKPRSFREIRLSLAWPENQEANRIVSDISDAISIILNKIKFSKVKTIFDEVGVEKNKLNNIRLKKLSFWDKLTIYFPERWVLKEDKKNKFVNVEIKKEKNLNLFFEILQIKVDNNKKDNDQIISNFLKEVTKDVVLEKQTLIKAEEDNYIFSFDTLEKNNLTEFQNHIWYRIFIKEGNILMISFVFNYKVEDILIGEVYYNKINELIKSSELN